MWEKSEVAQHLWAFVSQTELEMGEHLKILQSNGGGEYTAGKVQKYLKDKGVQHEMTTANTPQHNSITECMNCMLLKQV